MIGGRYRLRGGGLVQILRRVATDSDKLDAQTLEPAGKAAFWVGESVYSGARMTWEIDGRWQAIGDGHPFDILRRER